jgi:DNA-binding beta-propeller fold protein YncE
MKVARMMANKTARVGTLAALSAMGLLTGCGNTYRPVISSISPVGPAGQPTKFAAAVSSPSPGSPGLLTLVDFSGDTILSTPNILSNPSYFAITQTGTQGYVINSAGSFNDFGLSNPTGLLTADITQSTLPANSNPVSISIISLGSAGLTVFVPLQANSTVAALNGSGPSLEQQIGVGTTPVYVVGSDNAARVYSISQGTNNNGSGAPNCPTSGQVAAIEAATPLSVSNTICVGTTPVYGVMTADGRRAFILNNGSGTVSVINVINNALDIQTINPPPAPPTPVTITLPNITYKNSSGTTITAAPKPVWADITQVTNEMVVLNQGDGTGPGSLSIVNIPLCSSATQITNPTCNASNPVDATGFGTIAATVPVGVSPTMVAMLHDGTQAYVVNAKDSTGQCNAGEGSVTVVNLVTDQVQATICAISTPAGIGSVNASPYLIYGHPNTLAVTTGSPAGKVYVTSPDAEFMTVIYTDTDSVVTHIPLQGYGVRVLMTEP